MLEMTGSASKIEGLLQVLRESSFEVLEVSRTGRMAMRRATTPAASSRPSAPNHPTTPPTPSSTSPTTKPSPPNSKTRTKATEFEDQD